MTARAVLFLILFLSFAAAPLSAETFLERCPCGPDSVKGPFRLLLMQGHRGADFRDACRKHDLCYDTPGSCRKECDDLFLEDLLAVCDESKAPKMARFKAKLASWLVDNFGEGPFRSAQRIAREKAALAQK